MQGTSGGVPQGTGEETSILRPLPGETKQQFTRRVAEHEKEQSARRERERIGANPQARLDNMGAEERKRVDLSLTGLKAVEEMEKALEGGSNTFSIIGDNDYTLWRSHFEEALGRMNSGGAISGEEEKRFRKMAPTVWDTEDIQLQKIKALKEEMSKKLQTMGFEPGADRPALTGSDATGNRKDQSNQSSYAESEDDL